MSKFHSSPNGPGECKATKGRCPFGGESGEENHFDSMEAAEKAFENQNSNKALSTVSRKRNTFKHTYSDSEISRIKEKYPAAEVLEPGEYAMFEVGEGAEYSTQNPDIIEDYPVISRDNTESPLTEKSTDEEIIEYAKANNKNADFLRFTRDRMNEEVSSLTNSLEGDSDNGYNLTQEFYNVKELKKEYPGMFNDKGKIKDNPYIPQFEVKSRTPMLNAFKRGNPESLIEKADKIEMETGDFGPELRVYLGDPDSGKGGFIPKQS